MSHAELPRDMRTKCRTEQHTCYGEKHVFAPLTRSWTLFISSLSAGFLAISIL